MKKQIIILVFLFMGFNLLVSGQNQYLMLPPEQHPPVFGPECSGLQFPRVPPNTPWIVFSDRDNNDIFTNPARSTSMARVGMGKRFLAVSQSGNNMEVIEYNPLDIDLNIVQGTYVARRTGLIKGWISLDKLLLSKECLKICNIPGATQAFYPMRAMVTQSYDYQGILNPFFALAPGSNFLKQGFYTPSWILYVLKVVTIANRRFFLLGKNPKVEDYEMPEQVILGWKSESEIEFWKNRLLLEFNWTPEAVVERQRLNYKIRALDNPEGCRISCGIRDFSRCYPPDPLERTFYIQRDAGWYSGSRFPVISIGQAPECNTEKALFARKNYMGCSPGQQVIAPGGILSCEHLFDDAIECVKDFMVESYNVNLIFVIDASQSSIYHLKKEQMLSSITETAKKVQREISQEGLRAVGLRFAAVLFQDQHISQPEKTFKYIELNQNPVTVLNWVNTMMIPANETPSDYPEALFYALKKANQLFSGSNKRFQSNYFILLGDHGSHQRTTDSTFVHFNELRDLIHCSLDDYIIIQHSRVLRGTPAAEQASSLFQSQMNDLLLNVFTRNGEEDTILNQSGVFKRQSRSGSRSSFIYPSVNQDLPGQVITSEIEKLISGILPSLDNKIIQLSNLVLNGGNNPEISCLKQSMEVFIRKNPRYTGYCRNSETFNIFFQAIQVILNKTRSSNSSTVEAVQPPGGAQNIPSGWGDVFFYRYAALPFKLIGLEHPPFKMVVGLSKTEIQRMDQFIHTMSPMSGSVNTSTAIRDAWYHMLINILQVARHPADANQIRLRDAHALLTGYPGSTRLGDLCIGDIISRERFTNEMQNEYVVEWLITRGYLRSVTSGLYAVTPQYLTTYLGLINAVRHAHGRPPLTPANMTALAARFQVRDARSTQEYFRNYPSHRTDLKRGEVTYYVETNFFPSRESNFVDILVNYDPPGNYVGERPY